MKWYYIMVAIGVVALVADSAYENHEKAQIVTACYQTHQPNCDQIWKDK